MSGINQFPGTPFNPIKRNETEIFSRKGGLPCDGCDKTCLFAVDYYMVWDSVWVVEAGLPRDGCMLCRECLSVRLNRKLVLADFIDAPVNTLILTGIVKL